jgi:hypothetical protein
MKQLLETTLLEYEKSTFLVDLIKHDSGQLYVQIKQTIHHEGDRFESHDIKLNPTVLDDHIETLSLYRQHLPKTTTGQYFSDEIKAELKRRYLIGLSIDELALQFDCSNSIIEQILRSSGIELVSNELPADLRKKRFRRPKQQSR